jgi:hypothetical protein
MVTTKQIIIINTLKLRRKKSTHCARNHTQKKRVKEKERNKGSRKTTKNQTLWR